MLTALNAIGVVIRSSAYGNHYTTCPKCSASRRPENRKKPCLSVKIDAKGACYHCHHCGWKGAINDHQRQNGGIPAKAEAGRRNRVKAWRDELRSGW